MPHASAHTYRTQEHTLTSPHTVRRNVTDRPCRKHCLTSACNGSLPVIVQQGNTIERAPPALLHNARPPAARVTPPPRWQAGSRATIAFCHAAWQLLYRTAPLGPLPHHSPLPSLAPLPPPAPHPVRQVVMGDDTWAQLAPPHTTTARHTFPSFNVRDLDTVDDGVWRVGGLLAQPLKHDR